MSPKSDQAKEVKFVFQEWMSLLSKFKSDVDETLNVIRQDKREIQEIKREIYNRINKGQYMYDNDRIVISAPEIIIGNVDKSGQLKPGASRVTIRSNDINLEGVGENGQVQTKATSNNAPDHTNEPSSKTKAIPAIESRKKKAEKSRFRKEGT